jgi:hypothetical protein
VDIDETQAQHRFGKGVKAMATQPITPISRTQTAPKPKIELTRKSKLQWIDFGEVLRNAANEQEMELAAKILRNLFSQRFELHGPVMKTKDLRIISPKMMKIIYDFWQKILSIPYTVNVSNDYPEQITVDWDYHLKNGLPGSERKSVANQNTVTFEYPNGPLNIWSYSLWGFKGVPGEPDSQLFYTGERLVSDINAQEVEESGLFYSFTDYWYVDPAGAIG